MTEALIGFIAIFALALLRVPLAFGMGLVGIVGIGLTRSWGAALASTAQVVQETGFAYTLSVIPLFILMGNFVARAGLAHELFHAAYVFIGHLRGGLAHATIAACAGFGAICGSSIATAATMSKVAYPSMKKLGLSVAHVRRRLLSGLQRGRCRHHAGRHLPDPGRVASGAARLNCGQPDRVSTAGRRPSRPLP